MKCLLNSTKMLSKSKYIRGLNCQKSLWLYVHKRDQQAISEEKQAVFARGTNVGELARQYFPYGKMAVLEDYPGFKSAKRTQDFIEQGVETIYEATFVHEDIIIAADILNKENGKWYMYEVKSTNSTKPQHIDDIAIQYYVVKGESGFAPEDVFIMHFNRDYIKRGDINVKELFIADSMINQVLPLQDVIKDNLPLLFDIMNGEEPSIAMGKQCDAPYHCDFYDYCSSLINNSTNNDEKVNLSSAPEIAENEVKSFIKNVQYPLYYLDFETIMPAIPLYDESRPYQQIPFQYSLHHQNTEKSELIHEYYLAENNLYVDPRKALIEQLIKQTKTAKTIFVYNIAFEQTRISEMGRDFPQYANELNLINQKLVDLIIPFRKKYYRTETMEGSSSIKKVLPALCPEFSYDELEIGNGMAASNSFLDLYYCDDEEIKKQIRDNLLKYCHLDTLAMVKLFEVLKKV